MIKINYKNTETDNRQTSNKRYPSKSKRDKQKYRKG